MTQRRRHRRWVLTAAMSELCVISEKISWHIPSRRETPYVIYIYIYIRIYIYIYIYIKIICLIYQFSFICLREFGLQTIRHLCPRVRCSLAPAAVLLSGPVDVHVAQTLRSPRFIVFPPGPLEFKWLLVNKSIYCSGAAHRCSLDFVFSRLDRPLAPPTPKVCTCILF